VAKFKVNRYIIKQSFIVLSRNRKKAIIRPIVQSDIQATNREKEGLSILCSNVASQIASLHIAGATIIERCCDGCVTKVYSGA